MSDPSFQPLTSLLTILTKSISTIQTTFTSSNLPFPSPHLPYSPRSFSEELLAANEDVRTAVGRIVAACEQLMSMVRTPMDIICDAALGVCALISLSKY